MMKVQLVRFLQRFIVILEFANRGDNEFLDVLRRALEIRVNLENDKPDMETLASFEVDLQTWLRTGYFSKLPELEKAANQLGSVFQQIQEADGRLL